MENIIQQSILHVSAAHMLQRSYWYATNLITIITNAAETNGAYSLVKVFMRRGFDPPLHMHSIEDENNYILEGEIVYTVGDETIHAKAGDYVHLPKNVPHTFTVITETAATLLMITPAGFETMFIECGRPAETLELPPLNGKPPAAFFQKLIEVNTRLGATFFPAL